jgi:hypothetical protein
MLKISFALLSFGGAAYAWRTATDVDPKIRFAIMLAAVAYFITAATELPKAVDGLANGVAKLIALLPDPDPNRLTFDLTNNTGSDLYVRYHSMASPDVWPGNNRAYFVKNGAVHAITVRCTAGTHVCWGAWPANRSSYWGVGENPQNHCPSCCGICGPSALHRATLARR